MWFDPYSHTSFTFLFACATFYNFVLWSIIITFNSLLLCTCFVNFLNPFIFFLTLGSPVVFVLGVPSFLALGFSFCHYSLLMSQWCLVWACFFGRIFFFFLDSVQHFKCLQLPPSDIVHSIFCSLALKKNIFFYLDHTCPWLLSKSIAVFRLLLTCCSPICTCIITFHILFLDPIMNSVLLEFFGKV